MHQVPRSRVLDALLKECYTRPHYRCSQIRNLSIQIGPKQLALKHDIQDVAILGGGITGLATAYHLGRLNKTVQITLYESGLRLGGWLRSNSVDVGTGKVLFEQGPRTLRPSVPNGLETLSLIASLGLQDEILMTSKNSVAAQNRYIYYPDHLVRMPGPGSNLYQNISTVLFEPAFKNFLRSVVTELFRSKPQTVQDVSVGEFLTQNRFAPETVDNIVSAVFHGVYAGDVYQLSARSILPKLYKLAESYNSLVHGLYKEMRRDDKLQPMVDGTDTKNRWFSTMRHEGVPKSTVQLLEQATQSSVFTLKRGIGQLAETLERALKEQPNVTIVRNTEVLRLQMTGSGPRAKILIEPGSKKPMPYSHVISTISGTKLNAIVQPKNSLSALSHTPAVTVMVVNLYYSNPNLLAVHGFGYLLPRSIPFDQNPECALGVVFDSDATIGQDALPGTKLTVMLGGHWWDGRESYPDEEEGVYMAKAVLARHLGIAEEPGTIRVALQKDCIPQYTVGHASRMAQAHEQLLEHFQGRLKVAGNSYTGVGLNDCVRAARALIHAFLALPYETTGLEDLVPGLQKWDRVKKKIDDES